MAAFNDLCKMTERFFKEGGVIAEGQPAGSLIKSEEESVGAEVPFPFRQRLEDVGYEEFHFVLLPSVIVMHFANFFPQLYFEAQFFGYFPDSRFFWAFPFLYVAFGEEPVAILIPP